MLLAVSFIAFGLAACAHHHAITKACGIFMIASRPQRDDESGRVVIWTGIGVGLALGAGFAFARGV